MPFSALPFQNLSSNTELKVKHTPALFLSLLYVYRETKSIMTLRILPVVHWFGIYDLSSAVYSKADYYVAVSPRYQICNCRPTWCIISGNSLQYQHSTGRRGWLSIQLRYNCQNGWTMGPRKSSCVCSNRLYCELLGIRDHFWTTVSASKSGLESYGYYFNNKIYNESFKYSNNNSKNSIY